MLSAMQARTTSFGGRLKRSVVSAGTVQVTPASLQLKGPHAASSYLMHPKVEKRCRERSARARAHREQVASLSHCAGHDHIPIIVESDSPLAAHFAVCPVNHSFVGLAFAVLMYEVFCISGGCNASVISQHRCM